jgi:trimeric autotransporter adhesin
VKYRSILSVAWLALFVLPCSAQSSAFTYQGRLNFNNVPANGSYDFRFRLAADALGNTYIGGAVLSNALAVQGGLFNATLDFGAGVFTGSNYWLQIDVKTNGAGGYTTLNPLQAVTPTPYALFAAGASNVLGTVPGNKLSGTYGNVLNFSNAANSFNGTFTGNGAGLANVNALTLGGLAPGSFWQLTGNVVNAIDFFGSVNNQPVQLRVNNQRALRLEAAGGSVNLIGGWSNNFAAAGVTQGTIGGGGGESVATPGNFFTNRVFDSYGTIAGGSGNVAGNGTNGTADARGATVGGGSANTAAGAFSTIAGGTQNTVGRANSTIGGGLQNLMIDNPQGGEATIGGGYNNTNSGWAATIAGGWQNIVAGTSAAIGGGSSNSVTNDHGAVAGGAGNRVGGYGGFIGGGFVNVVDPNSYFSVIGGGNANRIGSNSSVAFIGGGQNNVASNSSATVGGGGNNLALGVSSVIAGGYQNSALETDAAIVGGYLNTVRGYRSFLGGGTGNIISNEYSVIGGGNGNVAFGGSAFIGTGFGNRVSGGGSVIIGGADNAADGGLSVIGGGQGHRAVANNSSIVGGLFNTNSGVLAFLGAGADNVVENSFAVLGGGHRNRASGNTAFLGGGVSNTASGPYSVLGGGGNNTASGRSAFLGGGGGYDFGGFGPYPNVASGDWSVLGGGWFNTASGYSSVVVGGSGNLADGYYATIGGGDGNRASGTFATVPGGAANVAAGIYSLAAGRNARAMNIGAYVWGDSGGTVASTNDNSVTMRAAGGYRLFSNTGMSSGVFLAPGGTSWSAISDRNAKKDFAPVDGVDVLEKLAALPITRWHYRWEEESATPHIGPMAQDFKAAFYPGRDDKSISTQEADGVALAAIQGLNRKLEHQRAENAELKQELAALKKLVQRLATTRADVE